MTSPFRHLTRLLLVLALIAGLAGALHAQPQPTEVAARAVRPAVTPPIPPVKSPVDQFRDLLALPTAERESRLTNRPPATRQRILAKLQEYDAMKPDERE